MGLTVKQVEKLIRDAIPGATADGGGLYLKITPAGSASWQYRYQINGARRMMGLGGCASVSLAEARERAAEVRKQASQGIDPIVAREQEQQAAASAKVRQATFQELAESYIASHRAGWRNAKHAQQWENTLASYVYPTIGALPPDAITTGHILDVLTPIWQSKPETASRVRNRIELVIDAAHARSGQGGLPNPAAWRGHLDKLLPKRSKISRKHHPALPYSLVPAFMSELKTREGMGALALRFTILSACRSGEVRGMVWGEVDLEGGLWVIPAERMKAANAHRVPLCDVAVQILRQVQPKDPKPVSLVFHGQKPDTALSDMSLSAVIRRMNEGEEHPKWMDPSCGREAVPHGFRSSFRDWAAEETHYPNIVAEQALAHVIENAAEAAYRRGDLLDKRRAMMADWARYCDGAASAAVADADVSG